jgi:HD superfamily phosphodiesterase
MKLPYKIKSAEKKLIHALESFFKSVYDDNKLPSHGIDHHRRVWRYAQELLQYIYPDEINENQPFVEKLLIACYLHDTGLAIEPGERHGLESRKICENFLSKNKLNKSDYEDVLNAIENHDKKEYLNSKLTDKLLQILIAADDLDAFGYIGIYRYLEIYIARGIDPAIVGNLILKNAQIRFDNFISVFGFANDLVKNHKIRFNILENFFRNYGRNVTSYQFRRSHPDGYCRISDIILKMLDEKKVLKDCLKEIGDYSDDQVMTDFFTGLTNELS